MANTWLSCCGRRGRWRNRWSSSRWWRWGRRWWARVQVDKNPESGEGDEIAAEEGNPEGITSRAGSEEISWKRSQAGLIRIKCFFGKKFPACVGEATRDYPGLPKAELFCPNKDILYLFSICLARFRTNGEILCKLARLHKFSSGIIFERQWMFWLVNLSFAELLCNIWRYERMRLIKRAECKWRLKS